MYEIFVYDYKSSYCFYDDVIDANKHPHIELGNRIYIPDLDMAYIVLSPGKWVPLGKSREPGQELNTSILGEANLGNLILGV